jgi:hypothetical protein
MRRRPIPTLLSRPNSVKTGSPSRANPTTTPRKSSTRARSTHPQGLKPALLMQADYTRKTQEVAEQRKALDTERQSLAQQAEAQAATVDERATLRAIESSLKQYQEIDWNAYTEQYGERAAITAQGQWRQLETAKADLQTEITRKETEHRSNREQATATALREADQVLSREVKGYGPQVIQAVRETAQTFGFSPQELVESLVGADGKPDVRSFKVLAELQELRAYKAKHDAQTTKAQAAQKQAAVQPAKTVGARAGGYKPGLDDSLPMDEWLRRRNAEERNAREATRPRR